MQTPEAPDPRPLLTERQVSERLRVAVSSLQKARTGIGRLAALPWIKVGGGARYDERDIEKFLAQGRRCARNPEAEPR